MELISVIDLEKNSVDKPELPRRKVPWYEHLDDFLALDFDLEWGIS